MGAMATREPTGLTYRDAGVDIDRGNSLVERIKPIARATRRAGVLQGLGGFGALFELPLDRYRNPVLVAGTDGVGTKLKLAIATGRHEGVGVDLVAMSANDIVVQGAEPLFFLDYYAAGRLDLEVATRVIAGIGRGCELAGMALIGGETAEMPGMYAEGDYDLAGFAVGIVDREAIIDGRRVEPGDVVLGLASSGPHSNGYSLIRRVLEVSGADLEQDLQGQPLADRLLAPTRIYVKPLLEAIRQADVRALAHITGGGITENLPRVLPPGTRAAIRRHAWPRPPVFEWLQAQGRISEEEMLRTFNCGVGMLIVVPPGAVEPVTRTLVGAGETVWPVGVIEADEGTAPRVVYA
jgi:phosphoribosylformylglycinamidine cyclo-ligase